MAITYKAEPVNTTAGRVYLIVFWVKGDGWVTSYPRREYKTLAGANRAIAKLNKGKNK